MVERTRESFPSGPPFTFAPCHTVQGFRKARLTGWLGLHVHQGISSPTTTPRFDPEMKEEAHEANVGHFLRREKCGCQAGELTDTLTEKEQRVGITDQSPGMFLVIYLS